MLDSTPLAEAERDHFDRQGYLIVRQALDPDTVARLLDAGDRLLASEAWVKENAGDGCLTTESINTFNETNLAPILRTWGSKVRFCESGYGAFSPIPATEAQAFVFDDDHSTAFLGREHLWWAVTAFWGFDLGVPIPVSSPAKVMPASRT